MITMPMKPGLEKVRGLLGKLAPLPWRWRRGSRGAAGAARRDVGTDGQARGWWKSGEGSGGIVGGRMGTGGHVGVLVRERPVVTFNGWDVVMRSTAIWMA